MHLLFSFLIAFVFLVYDAIFHAARCKAEGGNCLRHEKCGIFVGVWSRQMLLVPEF